MKNNEHNNNQLIKTPASYLQDTKDQQTSVLEELYKTLRELRVYQLELEVQNKELRDTREQLAESRTMYAELYDSAPIGYVTLTGSGCIYESNLSAAQMLHYDRSRLVGKSFAAFVDRDYTNLFFRHLHQCYQETEASTELCLVSSGNQIYVQLMSILVQPDAISSPRYRTIILDIHKHKQAGAAQQQAVATEKDVIENILYTEREQNKLESEIAHIRAEQLEQQLEIRTRELSQMALLFIEKHEWFSVLEKKLKQALWASPSKSKKILQQALHSLNNNLVESDTWNIFEQQLGETNRKFLHYMAVNYPSLTPAELKICCLLRLNLSTKEMAQLLHTSTKTIENQRYRIRKKLRISYQKNLTSFLLSI